MTARPITEDDLHAYVDQALDAARQAEVADYLADHPEVARRVEGYIKQREALRAALAPVAGEPVPPELNLARMLEAPRRPTWLSWRAAAAALLLLAVGGAGGWAARDVTPPPSEGIAALAQEAADNYLVYAPDRARPVEIKAADRAVLLTWVSNRLGRPVSAPDLSASGYRFMGGRLVATAHGPAALFLYDDDRGTRLALLMRPMTVDRNMPMSEHSRGAVEGIAWAEQGLGFSLVGPASSEALHPLADEVRRQIDNDA